jgi:hypothetical protein
MWAAMPVQTRAGILRDHVSDTLTRVAGMPGLELAILESLPPPARQPFTDLVTALRSWCNQS